ncbi:threonine transporter [Helicobacter monodelphidis]|uniref:LysE family transporter n=1 Tax=Helicobacter sp. 15-1451 TaxID=2004995 RepID=UPI000DCBF64C|nr:LysE family transporter [Helicobacter sp. 15-1451]RAX56810.1 threonine transporter [Helicobacter sp. 15-1451]
MDFLPILFIHFFALLLPGPDFFIVSSYALKANFKKALWVVFGVSLAIFVWIVLSLGGLKIVFEAFPFMKILLTLLGASYLLYLAYLLLKNLKQKESFKSLSYIDKPFIRGFMTNISNVKALFYFSSIFSSLDFSYHFLNLSFLVFLLVVESFLYFLIIAFFFSSSNIKNLYLKHSKKIDFICIFVFIGFVLYLFINLYKEFVNG